MQLFDSHCHVYDDRMPGGTAAAVAAARDAGVTAMVNVGCDRATSEAAIATAAAHDRVWATVGLHPHEASFGVETVVDLIGRPKVVAVGEAGLDYFYDHSPRDAQREAFAAQIQLAHEHDLPLVIHTRDAWDDTFLPMSRLIGSHDPKPAYLERLQRLIDWEAIRSSGIHLVVDPLFGTTREYLDIVSRESGPILIASSHAETSAMPGGIVIGAGRGNLKIPYRCVEEIRAVISFG